MMRFDIVFGNVPLRGYGIYVVLHVAYGRTYVEVEQDDGLLLSRGALGEVVLGGVVELTRKVTWGCHGVTTWLTQANTNARQYYFHVLTTYIRIYVLLFS